MRATLESRLERLLAVLSWLAEQGPTDLDELANRYRVSRHQLEKDLRLAQLMGLPPYDLPGDTPEIWIEDGEVFARVPEHLRTPPRLTRAEAFAVLASGRAALALEPDLPALAGAMEKLEGALALGPGPEVEIDEPPALEGLRAAQATRRRLLISYWSAWRDVHTRRLVDPYRVYYTDGAWYALCFDHESEELRLFRVDRVEELTPLDETFQIPDEVLAEEPASFRPPAEARLVRVRFPTEAWWVPEYVELDEIHRDDRGFTAELHAVGTRWLERLLLRTGGEVLAPDDLVGLTATAARRVLARYGEV